MTKIGSAIGFMAFAINSFAISVQQPVNFNNDTLGIYLKDEFNKNDWMMNPPSSSGLSEGRLHIIDDPSASGHEHVLEVTYNAGEVGGSSAMVFTPTIQAVNGTNQYTHLFFRYQVYFPTIPCGDGAPAGTTCFDWVNGGKLPGLTSAPDSPTGCVEGTTYDGFSARVMWKNVVDSAKCADGAQCQAVSYLYFPDKTEGCGSYKYDLPAVYFKRDTWYTLTQEVILNDVVDGQAQSNGEIKQWVNDKLVLDLTGIILRKSSNIFIDEIKMDTFFGGSDASTWAPPSDQHAYFDNFEVSAEPFTNSKNKRRR